MGSPEEGLQRVSLSRHAERDLLKLQKKSPTHFSRIWNDLKRFDQGTLPQTPKKLRSLANLWQFDSGDFRIVYQRGEDLRLTTVAVLSKSQQKARFRSLG